MIKNYTTTVGEDKTVGEIMGLLAAKGARSIKIDYDQQNRPEAVSFIIHVKTNSAEELGIPIPYKLPCNFEGVFRAIARSYKDRYARARYERSPANAEQARRVAWRIIKDWIDAQLALVEADCAALAQVFLPYAVVRDTPNGPITAFDRFLESVSGQKSLNAAPDSEEVGEAAEVIE